MEILIKTKNDDMLKLFAQRINRCRDQQKLVDEFNILRRIIKETGGYEEVTKVIYRLCIISKRIEEIISHSY